jgi:acid phosphatase
MTSHLKALLLAAAAVPAAAAGPAWPEGLPVYDHVVVVVEENKDYEQIVGNPKAPYINQVLLREGASFSRMFAEEHASEGNYFWLFSGANQDVGYRDRVPAAALAAPSLAGQLLAAGRSFKGFAEDLPAPGSTVAKAGHYARKHVPYASFKDVPANANRPFSDFPAPDQYQGLPTVAWVIPNLVDDMHDCAGPGPDGCIAQGDAWLQSHLDAYYQWAKTHNSLLLLTFDESDDPVGYRGPTDPAADPDQPGADPAAAPLRRALRNRILTLAAGARIKAGAYAEGKGITHVNLLRTLEAMYGLPKIGAQQEHASRYGIGDQPVTDIFN